MSTIERLEKMHKKLVAVANALKPSLNPDDEQESFADRKAFLDDLNAALPALIAVARKAEAVNARWETPTWKSAEPTAKLMNELRDALATLKEQP